MKTLLRIFAAVMLMGLITVSCSKPGNVYDGTISGEKMELKTPREGCLIFVYQLTRVYLTY